MKAAPAILDWPRSLVSGKFDIDCAWFEKGMTFRLVQKIVETPFFQKIEDKNVCIAFVAKLATSIAMTILHTIEALLFLFVGAPILSLVILGEWLFCKKVSQTADISSAFIGLGVALSAMFLSYPVMVKGPFEPKNEEYFC